MPQRSWSITRDRNTDRPRQSTEASDTHTVGASYTDRRGESQTVWRADFWGVDAEDSPDTRARGEISDSSPGSSRRPSYAPHPLRELLKPILDELKDKLESFEGEPTPEDHRWLRGQLRKLADRLATE